MKILTRRFRELQNNSFFIETLNEMDWRTWNSIYSKLAKQSLPNIGAQAITYCLEKLMRNETD